MKIQQRHGMRRARNGQLRDLRDVCRLCLCSFLIPSLCNSCSCRSCSPVSLPPLLRQSDRPLNFAQACALARWM